MAVRRACYGVMRYVMESEAKGCELIISGKVRGQRAKAMKFRDGYMVKSGNAARHYVDKATRHICLKQGVLGIKVAITLPYDPTGRNGVALPQPDVVIVKDPKEEAPLPNQPVNAPNQPKQGFAQNVALPQGPATGAHLEQGPLPGHGAQQR